MGPGDFKRKYKYRTSAVRAIGGIAFEADPFGC